MRTDTPHYIANEALVWLHADGTRTRIVARLGQPYPVDDHTWACPAELEGVDPRYPDIFGSSSLQALNLATTLLATRLGHLLERGERLFHEQDASCAWDGESLRVVFGLPRVPAVSGSS